MTLTSNDIIYLRSVDDLKSIINPVLVSIGDHDVINSEKSLEKAQKFLVKSKTIIIKDAGHFLSVDQSEVVNEAIIPIIIQNKLYNSFLSRPYFYIK